jgi:hypothetical protein
LLRIDALRIPQATLAAIGTSKGSNEWQPTNASLAMQVRCESFSIINSPREVQSLKHFASSDSTDRGITIDRSDEQFENANEGIDRILQTGSNVTDEIEVQSEKQDLERISTERGIKIDLNDEQL